MNGYPANFAASTCDSSQSCPFYNDGLERHYDDYTFANETGQSVCVTVSYTDTCDSELESSAFFKFFDPEDPCPTYLGSSLRFGTSGTYSFNVPAGATFVVIVQEMDSGAGCGSYTLTVTGLGCQVTPTGTPPTATSTRTRIPTRTRTVTPTITPTPDVCGPNSNYTIVFSGGTIVPGTTLVPDSQCDDCTVPLGLPFTYNFYGVPYNVATATDNGILAFVQNTSTFANECLPYPFVSNAIMPHWDDTLTTPAGDGIYTSLTGTAPNRIFNIEWRTSYFAGGGVANYEVRLYEGQDRFDLVYGVVDNQGISATVGAQKDDGSLLYTSYECFSGGVFDGLQMEFVQLPCGTSTPGITPTVPATNTGTRVPTSTPTPMSTSTYTATGTSTYTDTPIITGSPVATDTPTATPTLCPITFTDVDPSQYFYTAVQYLYCHGAISGYADNTFRPYNYTSRGQICKIVVLAYGFTIYIPPQPTFTDVPMDHPFYSYIETAAHSSIVTGYADGTFRPYNNVTRGQLCKIVVVAAGWTLLNPTAPTFTDVPTDHPFYQYIETAYCHGIISGYAGNIFLPGNNATRGQISKIVYLALVGAASCP